MSTAPRYTHEVGRKFHADGSPRMFPGNTIICFVDPESPIGRAGQAFQADLARQPFGRKFAPLPPASFHMTVMELLCDQVRAPERWSSELALDAPLAATDAFFIERAAPIDPPGAIVMAVDTLAHRGGLMITLQPATAAVAAGLRAYRDALAAATGVRAPDHDRYGFHISLAYRLIELEDAEQRALADFAAGWTARVRAAAAEVALGRPTLTFFDDMFRFVPGEARATLRSR